MIHIPAKFHFLRTKFTLHVKMVVKKLFCLKYINFRCILKFVTHFQLFLNLFNLTTFSNSNIIEH